LDRVLIARTRSLSEYRRKKTEYWPASLKIVPNRLEFLPM
jgi:hypothetical protein